LLFGWFADLKWSVMSQTFNKYNDVPYSFLSTNRNIFVDTNETIILDEISVNAISNFGVTIVNQSDYGSIVDVIVYGTEDGVNWFILQGDIFPMPILSNTAQHSEFYGMVGTARITARANASNVNIDVYFRGTST
jgi:hypothetical protein